MLAFSVTGFEQICARWRAVVANYNKSTNCANMPKTVRLKCSTGAHYGYMSGCKIPRFKRERVALHP